METSGIVRGVDKDVPSPWYVSPRTILAVGAVVVLVALLLRIVFFAVSIHTLPVSSDESLSVLQGKDIRQGDRPLLIKGNPYQFPIESYLQAPFVFMLPRTPLGARLIPFVEGLLATAVFLLPFLFLGRLRDTWPGMLLALFPSAYLLMLQSAYFIPEHTSLALLCAGAVALATAPPVRGRMALWVALGGGLLAGLAVSTHMVSLPVACMAVAVIVLRHPWRTHPWIAPVCVAGLLSGLLPYFAAKVLIPHAYESISSLRPWRHMLLSLRSPMLEHALAEGLGLSPCLYPDTKHGVPAVVWLDLLFLLVWGLCFAMVTVLRAWRFGQRTVAQRRVSLRPDDLFIGASWATLLCFLASARSDAYTVRFLLPVLWCFPFLWSYLYRSLPHAWRCVAAGVTVVMVALNIAGGIRLMSTWCRYPFAERETPYLNLGPALDYLRERGISRVYASPWTAYRINFLTDEGIVAAEPFNFRFPHWPCPGRDQVQASTNVAFVLEPHLMLTSSRFDEDLAAEQVSCSRRILGHYTVYTDFRAVYGQNEQSFRPARLQVSSSHNPDHAAALCDGSTHNGWTSHAEQAAGMRIEFTWPDKQPLTRCSLAYRDYRIESARALTVSLHTEGGWTALTNRLPAHIERFSFINGHPEYGPHIQTVQFKPTLADGIRFEIDTPRSGLAWSIREVELYRSSTNAGGPTRVY